MLKSNHVIRLVLALGLAVTLFAAGCGSSGNQSQGTAENGSTNAGGGQTTDTTARGSAAGNSGEEIEVGNTEALVWGKGDYGLVMAHGAIYDAASWKSQARQIAQDGMVALAVEDTSADNLIAAAKYLKEERSVQGVAFMGASAGASGVLQAAEEKPGVPDQLILISGTGDVSGLGSYPKLFVASEGEGLAGEVREMADEAAGNRNKALILPGDAHAQAIFETNQGDNLMQAILERLQQYR